MAIDLFSIGRFTVHGYGLMIGLGFVFAVLLGTKLAQKQGLNADYLSSLAIWVLVIGFLGGKTLHIIVNFSDFIKNPIRELGSSGFVVFGGIITGIATIFVYCRMKKINALEYLDVIAVATPVNQAMGRIGCFLAGCCYGRSTNLPIGVVFPEGCLAPAGVKLLPTQLFMAAGDFMICLILLYYIKNKRKIIGMTSVGYLLLYSIGRFIIEFVRDDYRGSVGFLSTSQFISILSVVVAIIGYVILKKVGKPVAAIENSSETKENQ